MKRTISLALGFIALLACAGCKDITGVQKGYVSARDQCQTDSQKEVGVYTPSGSYPMSTKEMSTAQLTLFCECMRQKEWKVAGCPKPPEKEVAKPAVPPAPNTTVVVVQAPAAAAAPAPQAAPVQSAPPPAHKVKHPKKVCPAAPAVCSTTDGAPFDDSDTATLKKILNKEN